MVQRIDPWHHWQLSMLVAGLLAAHALEALLFGFVCWWMVGDNDYGCIVGAETSGGAKCIYVSFIIVTLPWVMVIWPPRGRCISWPGSFLYLQMGRIVCGSIICISSLTCDASQWVHANDGMPGGEVCGR